MTRPTPDPLARCGFSTRQMKELEKEMKELEEQKEEQISMRYGHAEWK